MRHGVTIGSGFRAAVIGVLTVLFALMGGVVPASAGAVTPVVTLAAFPVTPLLQGAPLLFKGHLSRADVPMVNTLVSIWSIPYGSLTWHQVGVVKTDGRGDWSDFQDTEATKYAYQARYASASISTRSASVLVSPIPNPILTLEASTLTPAVGATVILSGRVTQGGERLDRARLTVFRYDEGDPAGGTHAITIATTNASGLWSYAVTAQPGKTDYSALYENAAHIEGPSPVVRVIATP